MKLFHIVTIANNLELYRAMKESFLQADFNEECCRYSLFDNSLENTHDPYAILNQVYPPTTEPYLIFCHQDILLDQGDRLEDLIQALQDLEQQDATWAIAGNAGIKENYQGVYCLNDPTSPQSHFEHPQRVHSLDENFLVIKTHLKLGCSPELKGFHLYGSDLCLRAILQGYSCYVINFKLTHLSQGQFSQFYWEIKKSFEHYWGQFFYCCYIKTTMEVLIFLSRYAWLSRLAKNKHFSRIMMSKKLNLKRFINPYFQRKLMAYHFP